MSLLVKNNSLTKGMVHHKYNNRIQLICVTQVELLVLKSQEMEYIYETEICWMSYFLYAMIQLSIMAFNL